MKIRNIQLNSKNDEVNLGLLALIQLEDSPEKGRVIRLLATLNPDADEPIQGEEYSSEWTATWFEVSSQGFWKVWDNINAQTPGKISLNDGLSVIQALCYIGMDQFPVITGTSAELANLFVALEPGQYLVEAVR